MSEQLPILLRRWDGGLVTELSSDELDVTMSPNMANANFRKGGSVKKEAGYRKLGEDTSEEVISELMVLSNRQGDEEWLIKISGTNIKLYDSVNGVYHLLKSGVTAGLEWGYILFNNILHLGNQIDNAITFDLGKITRLNGAITNGATDIILDDASQLSASGTVMINGAEVTYTGKTDNTLTGCTGAVATPDNYLVTAPTSNHGTVPKGNVYEEYGGRLIIANVLGSGASTVYGSKATDRTDFTITGGGASDDAFAAALSAKVNSVRGFRDDSGVARLMAFLADDTIAAIGIDDDATLGTLVAINPFKKGVTALRHKSNLVGTNDIFHVDSKNQVRTLGSTYANRGIDNVFSDSISKTLATHFKDDCDFSKSQAVFLDDEYWIMLKEDSEGVYNNAFYIYDITRKAWRRRTGINPSAVAVYGGRIIFSDCQKNEIYEIDSKLLDDNGSSIYFRYDTMDFDLNPLAFERNRAVRLSGLMSSNCIATVRVYRDFGTVLIGEFTIRGDNQDIVGSILGEEGSFGSVAFGEEIAGGEGEINKRFFIAHLELKTLPDFENFRVSVTNNQAGVYLEISKMKPFMIPMDEFYFPKKYIIKVNS